MGDGAVWWLLALGLAAGLAGVVGGVRPGRAPWSRRPQRPASDGEGEPWPLVVLVRDAAAFIEGIVDELAALAPGSPIVVVDCGSTDETPCIVQRMRQRVPTLQVLCWPADRGGGPSPLEAALFVTGAPLAVTLDLTNPGLFRWQDLRSPLLRLLDAAASGRKSMTG